MSILFKQCKKCEEWKSEKDFHNDKRRKDGKYPNCKECHYSYVRERYKREDVKIKHKKRHADLQKNSQEYRKAAKERSHRFYGSISGRAKTLLSGLRRRQPGATVTLEKLLFLLEIGHCAVTGIKFDMSTGIRDTGITYNPYAPSVDRIIPKLGYTDENIRLVIWHYNLMKGELSDDFVFDLCKLIAERHRK